MDISICTLFEGNYHYGVAALTNSLYKCGFRGDIYVGYRGDLPKWASESIYNDKLKWEDGKTLFVEEGIYLHFLPLNTDYHLTNFKPDFMLQLFEKFQLDSLFYFDPDIIVIAKWTRFLAWLKIGVCLCEDINSPYGLMHPRRFYWAEYYKKFDINLVCKEIFYVNGGFIGIQKSHISFLRSWLMIQEQMSEAIGGLKMSTLNAQHNKTGYFGEFGCFDRTDQDALNITFQIFDSGKISIIGKEAMGFTFEGEVLMYHALGTPKPWNYQFLKNAISGHVVSQPVKTYWSTILKGPILPYKKILVYLNLFKIYSALLIGRFYRK